MSQYYPAGYDPAQCGIAHAAGHGTAGHGTAGQGTSGHAGPPGSEPGRRIQEQDNRQPPVPPQRQRPGVSGQWRYLPPRGRLYPPGIPCPPGQHRYPRDPSIPSRLAQPFDLQGHEPRRPWLRLHPLYGGLGFLLATVIAMGILAFAVR